MTSLIIFFSNIAVCIMWMWSGAWWKDSHALDVKTWQLFSVALNVPTVMTFITKECGAYFLSLLPSPALRPLCFWYVCAQCKKMLKYTVAQYSDVFLLSNIWGEGRVNIFCEVIFGYCPVYIWVQSSPLAVTGIRRNYCGDIVLFKVSFLQWNRW